MLASDGLPVVCSPMDVRGVAAVAEAGATGSPSVATFTVGVVTAERGAARRWPTWA